MNHLFHYLLLLVLVLALGACADDSDSFLADQENGLSGSITRFAVHNGYMYSLNPNGINTYDLSDADNPQLVHTINTDYGLETITIYDGIIYIGSTTSLYILGIDEPSRPVILSQTGREEVIMGDGCDPVVVRNNYAYSTVKIINEICGSFNAESQLITFEVSDPRAPQIVSSYPLDEPNGLGYSDTHLFVCDRDHVLVFSLENPADPQLTAFSIAVPEAVDVIVRQDMLLVSSKTAFNFFDISDVSNIRPLSVILK